MGTIKIILNLAGALGVFLLGMRLMSEGLQKVAGSKLKSLIRKITSNRFSGVLTGFVVTSVIQSSSATTVMVVSFVSASLLTLTQAIGVIMGANIGTTVTGWLVALLGFKVKISAFALPAIGLGFAAGFAKRPNLKHSGEVLLGFGLLFLGLGLLKDAVPALSGPESLVWVRDLTSHGFFSIIIFVLLGTALTVVLQSSSATMTLTLTFAALGWLPYEMAAAMVLGENIGTTATANLAAIGAPVPAKRAARAHFIFNVFGATWALALMSLVLLPVVDWLVPGAPNIDFAALQGNEEGLLNARAVVTTHLAAFHTLFNVTNTMLLLPFVDQLVKVVTRWVPDSKAKTTTRALYLSTPLLSTPELSLVQTRKEMHHMTEVVRRMFTDSMTILKNPNESLGTLVEDTLEREDIVDDLEVEISNHLSQTAQASTTSAVSIKIAEMIQNTHRLERIGDHCAVLVRIARRLHQDPDTVLQEHEIENITKIGGLVDKALDNLGRYLAGEKGVAAQAEALEDEIDNTRREMREEQIARLEEREGEDMITGIAFLDLLTHLEEIGDRAVGIIRQAEAARKD